jgi:glycosyltransferase involved in cell wall biosynthesis
MPSRKEGLPYALLEALAAGLPIVATEVGAMPGVLANGRAGLLVPPGAPGDITASLNSLLGNAELCAKLTSAAAGQVQRNHSLDHMAKATLATYS